MSLYKNQGEDILRRYGKRPLLRTMHAETSFSQCFNCLYPHLCDMNRTVETGCKRPTRVISNPARRLSLLAGLHYKANRINRCNISHKAETDLHRQVQREPIRYGECHQLLRKRLPSLPDVGE
ncbi:conserved hypothetical protein [Ktedonobacter racemifer DSM 44963]|uniref:Uncharacterized protein n=1 Tax=Ktedonobacter racemifer DSM 44963 TaxID=485913 RepID=D6TLG7_KTERA|nr:conserved hypothetical protein [Ktedonobacter racemifer DSM 44963]